MTEQLGAVLGNSEQAPAKRGPKPKAPQATDRQRPIGETSVDEAQRTGQIMGDPRDANAAVTQSRVRIPLNSGQKLSLRGYKLDWDNFHYHWFSEKSDQMGRVADALEAAYEHCKHPDGSNITSPSGAGKTYLMRVPKKFWLEDMAASRDRRNALRKKEAQLGKNEYTTDDRGRIVTKGEMHVKQHVSDRMSSAPNPFAD
jgi:hypothetical protein